MEQRATGDIQAAIEAGKTIGRQTGIPQLTNNMVPFIVLPNAQGGQDVRSLECLLRDPLRIKAAANFADVASFCAYVNEYKNDGTKFFADTDDHQVTALLDYHGVESPSACTHSAMLNLALSAEWKRWTGKAERQIDQVTFAQFIEDYADDITEPEGAAVLEFASHLEGKKGATFKGAVNLTHGTKALEYVESVEARGKGNMPLIERFTLGIPVFEHGDPVEVHVRLRFRISDDGKLAFIFKMLDVENVIRREFEAVLARVKDGTGIAPYLGSVVTK